MISLRAGYSSFSSPTIHGIAGGLAHSELYTDASCRCYYKAGQGTRFCCSNGNPNSTPFSPMIMTAYCDVKPEWEQPVCTNSAFIHIHLGLLLGCSRVYVCLVSATRQGTSSRVMSFPPTGSWRMESVCWKRRIPAGQFLQAKLGRELPQVPNWGFGEREMTGCGWDLRKRRALGPRSLQAWLGSSSFPCSLLKGNYVTAGTRQLSFVNIFFFSRVMLEKDTHKLCLRTVHSGITGISQSSF